jgi:hypothetical protein
MERESIKVSTAFSAIFSTIFSELFTGIFIELSAFRGADSSTLVFNI